MAGSYSDQMENKVLDWSLNVGAPTRPPGTWLAAYTVAPTDSTAGTEVTNAGAYARVAITFTAGAAGATSNSALTSFPAATASWGTVVAVAVVDSATHGAGNIIFYTTLDTNKAVGIGDILEFAAGAINFTLT